MNLKYLRGEYFLEAMACSLYNSLREVHILCPLSGVPKQFI